MGKPIVETNLSLTMIPITFIKNYDPKVYVNDGNPALAKPGGDRQKGKDNTPIT